MITERGFWLALPDDWARVPMDSSSLEQIEAFVERCAGPLEAAGMPVAEARAELRSAAHEMDTVDVVFAAAWVAGEGDGAVHANLTALIIPAGTVGELDDPVWDLTTLSDDDVSRTIMRRTRTRTSTGLLARFGFRRVGTAEYFVEVPGRPLWLLITFTSPSIAIWDDLLELFDAIALSAEFGSGLDVA